MDLADNRAIDYLIGRATDPTLTAAKRNQEARRLVRYMATVRNPRATRAQVAANAKVVREATVHILRAEFGADLVVNAS